MNKADFTTLINTNLPDGGSIASADHRATMITNANSIGELVYGAGVSDNETSQTYTTSNANFDYTLFMYKTGNNVTLSCRITCQSFSNPTETVFEISDTDYIGKTGERFNTIAQRQFSEDRIGLYLIGDRLALTNSCLAGEIFYFTINFNAEN